jgi:hypothetical protein
VTLPSFRSTSKVELALWSPAANLISSTVLSWLTNKIKSRSEALCALLLSDVPGDT